MSYSVQPICVGTINADKSTLTYMRGFGQRLDVPILIWVLRSASGVVVVDTGAHPSAFRPEDAARRRQSESQRLDPALAAAGIDPAEIRTVILTHLHYDHAGNCDRFPNADLIVQRRELEYAHDPLPAHRRVYDSPALALPIDRWTVVDGDHEVASGVSVVLTPGHSPGLQAVVVETVSGRLVLACDTVPLAENWAGAPPDLVRIPTGSFVDLRAVYGSLDRLAEIGARVVPGHDADVLREDWPR